MTFNTEKFQERIGLISYNAYIKHIVRKNSNGDVFYDENLQQTRT